MVMYTARLTKTRIAVIVGVLFVLLMMVIMGVSSLKGKTQDTLGGIKTEVSFKGIRTNDDRVAFLNAFGWEVGADPIAIEEVVIPAEFDDVYTQYNEIQQYQGLDLSRYRGKTVKRYTYRVTNYPGGEEANANILVYKERVIGGDVCSAEFEGFMHGFERLNY